MSNKSFFVLAPLALLGTACEFRTPATALDAASDTQLATHETVLPSDREAIAAWQLPTTNPWSRYEKLTLLTYLADQPVTATMPEVGQLDVVRRAQAAASRLAMVGMPSNTMWVVDLRGPASVAFGATLSRLSVQPVAPVMTFNNWPAELEVVPAEQTLAALVSMRPKPLSPLEPVATPVFMLDAWRLAFQESEPDPEAVDNRYMLLSSDFPDPLELRARGITRIVYVVEDRGAAGTEEDDFHEAALAYQDAGIGIALVDLLELGELGDVATPDRWVACLDRWSFEINVRSTIFDSPGFYARARGGFGGVRAAPARTYTAAHPSIGHPSGASSVHTGGMGSHGGGRAYSGASPHVGGHGGG